MGSSSILASPMPSSGTCCPDGTHGPTRHRSVTQAPCWLSWPNGGPKPIASRLRSSTLPPLPRLMPPLLSSVSGASALVVNLALRPLSRLFDGQPMRTNVAQLGGRDCLSRLGRGACARADAAGSALESTNIEDTDRVEIASEVHGEGVKASVLEQIVRSGALGHLPPAARFCRRAAALPKRPLRPCAA